MVSVIFSIILLNMLNSEQMTNKKTKIYDFQQQLEPVQFHAVMVYILPLQVASFECRLWNKL